MNDNYEEIEEQLMLVSEYYSEVTGRNIEAGIDEDLDIWISSSRTNGREYFEAIRDVESRIKQLYSDMMLDDQDDTDPYAGMI